MNKTYDYAVYSTQGGGLVRSRYSELKREDCFIFPHSITNKGVIFIKVSDQLCWNTKDKKYLPAIDEFVVEKIIPDGHYDINNLEAGVR